MFSGKTTALLARLRDAQQPTGGVVLFKPTRDTRYSEHQVVSHDGVAMTAVNVERAELLGELAGEASIVGIDEVHFFDPPLVAVCEALAGTGRRIIAAGVDLDHRGNPFEIVRQLETIAAEVVRLTAICSRCGGVARFSQRLVASDDPIVVGGAGDYEPRCDRCFQPGR
jgi:thymidine kinase